ncbi:MAG: DUF3291 domain-containing protein [Parvularculaceae bacterium]
MKHHLAQINIAQAKADMTSEIMHGFVSRLDEINAIADKADGFIWRLQSDEGDATSIRVFNNPLLLVNMSVWRDLPALKNFVYQSLHVKLIRDREAWFDKIQAMHQALWWIPAGHIPDAQEAKNKLEHIRTNGPSQEAFTFGKPFSSPQ